MDDDASADTAVVAVFRDRFARTRAYAEAAVAQVGESALTQTLGGAVSSEGENTLATLLHHVGGNLRSRFTDFLTTDGEAPTRHRDAEFDAVDPALARQAWTDGWAALFGTLDALTDADLARTVTLRQAPLSVLDALLRALAHANLHAGQIVLLAKHHAGAAWTPLSIPKGQSAAYTARPFDGAAARG